MSKEKKDGPIREKLEIVYGPEDGFFHVNGPKDTLVYLGMLELAKVAHFDARTQMSIKSVFDNVVAREKAKMEKPGRIIEPPHGFGNPN
jgi:hypothetical protein